MGKDTQRKGRYCKQVDYELFSDTFRDYATHLISGAEASRRLGVDYQTFRHWALECFTYGTIRRDFYFIKGNTKQNGQIKRVLKNGKYEVKRVGSDGRDEDWARWRY